MLANGLQIATVLDMWPAWLKLLVVACKVITFLISVRFLSISVVRTVPRRLLPPTHGHCQHLQQVQIRMPQQVTRRTHIRLLSREHFYPGILACLALVVGVGELNHGFAT
jgi:hypothetical protein